MISIVINGQPANVRDLKSIGFRSVFEDEYNQLELNVETLMLVNESRNQIYDWVYGSGPGVGVGIPCTINYGSISLDYFIDLRSGVKFRGREVEVSIKRRFSKDAFFDRARGTSFELLSSKGVQFPGFSLPYVIVTKEMLSTAFMTFFALFSLFEISVRLAREAKVLVIEFQQAVTSLKSGGSDRVELKICQFLAYSALVVSQIVILGNNLFRLISPKIRFFNCCFVKDLLITGCANIGGYSFQSTLLDQIDGLAIATVPLQKTNKSMFSFMQNDLVESFTKGHPTSSDTTETLGDLFEALELVFNAETKVSNQTVRLERRDYWQDLAQIQKTPFLNIKERRENEFTLNTDGIWSRYLLKYQVDNLDINTFDNYEVSDAEYGAENLNLPYSDLNLISGLVKKPLPFALGTRKSEYNWVEKIAIQMFGIIDSIVGTNLSNSIESRIGVLQISEQFFSVSKLIVVENSRIKENQYDLIGAPALWNNYHSIQSIEANAFREYDSAEIDLNLEQFESLMENNYINFNGVPSKILEIVYVPDASKGTIRYQVADNYAQGKINTFTVNA